MSEVIHGACLCGRIMFDVHEPEVMGGCHCTRCTRWTGGAGSTVVVVAAKNFKVFYAQVPGKTEGSYTVDHTAGSYVFDASGKVRLFVRYGSGAEALAHDLKLLLAEDPA